MVSKESADGANRVSTRHLLPQGQPKIFFSSECGQDDENRRGGYPPSTSRPVYLGWETKKDQDGNEDVKADVKEEDEEDEFEKRVGEVLASGEFQIS
ncbi:hypothetical protein FEM48_Zijuj04G0200500 [Ziziphus jujuba var. spinosa]|uniref:Uncharacterized protein n=1 Tax=Ziziphus jujuba var. spinosa TaxID=714518 RepID=A0A978VLX2_ZIZJJ|nr:hypothetical protein FEM48_Zijuj04G0200500 [Ziziphus jujuba var. spinosa]